jgi:ubiquinol-cytochrome c reductase cytochrome b subunit
MKGKFTGLGKAVLVVVALLFLAGFGLFSYTSGGNTHLAGIDAKFWGVCIMGASVLILFFLPWLDHSPVKSIRYRPGWHKAVLTVWVVAFFILGWLGTLEPDPVKTIMAQVCTVIYFAFFLLMPWWSQMGTFKPVPDRVTFHPH